MSELSDYDWATSMDSVAFLDMLYYMCDANVNCNFAQAEHDENEEFRILADMIYEHLKKHGHKE